MPPCKARLRTKAAALLLIAAVGALAGPSFARDPREKMWRKACTADAFHLCPLQAITANRNGVRDCLLHNMDKVSDTCVAVIRAAQQPELTATVPPSTQH